MKQLIIARHAKSSRNNIFCPDFDRWLNTRGKNDLSKMGELLAQYIKIPDEIFSSPAKRTKKTALAYAKAWWYKKKNIVWDKDIYEASLERLLSVIEKTDENTNRLVLVWHNPWLTELVISCGYELENLPTCGVVVFEYSGDLRGNFEPKKCALVSKLFPKEVG